MVLIVSTVHLGTALTTRNPTLGDGVPGAAGLRKPDRCIGGSVFQAPPRQMRLGLLFGWAGGSSLGLFA